MIYEVINNFSQYDGISTVARNLAEEFQENGEEVEILYLKTTRGEEVPETDVEARQLTIPEMFNLFRKTDAVVHTHFGHSAAIAGLARRFNSSMKHVHTYHGIVPEEWYDNFRRDYYFYQFLFRAGKMDEVVAISEFEKDELQDFYGRDSTLVYNGVDTGRFYSDPEAGQKYREEQGIPEGKTVLGYVARMHEQKNHLMLVDVIDQLPDEYHLLLGGDGPRKEDVEERIEELGVEDRVTLAGWVENDELLEFFNASDVYLCPSLCEGFGLTTLEAMACDVPVVVKKGTAVEEFVEDSAYLVDTPEEMAEAAEKVAGNGDQHPREQAENYSWENIGDEYLEVLLD